MKRYRLRKDNNIVGYAEHTTHGLCIRSNRAFWWFPGVLTYNQTDQYVGIKDNKGNDIYELDIVLYRSVLVDEQWSKAVVLWEKQEQLFGLLDVFSRDFFPLILEDLFLFRSVDLIIKKHLFMCPKLVENLGLEHCI